MAGKYDVASLRKTLKENKGSARDPAEFKPPQVKEGERKVYRFYVLPPVQQGEKVEGGVATKSMELYGVSNGSHWIHNRPHACPRVHDQEDCPMCAYGFERMSETQDKKQKSAIAKAYLPGPRLALNIYFPNDSNNPEELKDKNMWFNAPKQVTDLFEECVNRDDAGDIADPKAHGVFFDETAAYLFQLEITHKGGYNDYSSSKFLASVGPLPIAFSYDAAKNRIPNQPAIDAILARRFDLFTKFDARDAAKLQDLVLKISDTPPATTGGGFSKDETTGSAATVAESVANQPAPATRPAPAATRPAPAPAAAAPAAPAATTTPVAASAPAASAAPVDMGTDDAELQALLNEMAT
jgi:hypothetical protein